MNKTLETELCHWYEKNHRKLPWRVSRNPYEIWISETMLQQTRVETVIPYYHRFLEAFPTVQDLAKAEEEQVLKLWEGLGYYSRARNLHTAAKEIMFNYNGVLPKDPKELSKLKGFGPYTTGAVASIAYNLCIPAVDGNVMRVMSRIEKCASDIAKSKTKKEIEGFVLAHMKVCEPRILNQALMELGATICLPKNPKCEICPVQDFCLAYQKGCVDKLPVKSKAKARKKETRMVFYVRDALKGTWVQKRAATGLLANLYELPHMMVDEETKKTCEQIHDEEMYQDFIHEDGAIFRIKNYMMTLVHIFTHIEWELIVMEAEVIGISDDAKGRFCTKEEITQLPFAAPFLKIMNTVLI